MCIWLGCFVVFMFLFIYLFIYSYLKCCLSFRYFTPENCSTSCFLQMCIQCTIKHQRFEISFNNGFFFIKNIFHFKYILFEFYIRIAVDQWFNPLKFRHVDHKLGCRGAVQIHAKEEAAHRTGLEVGRGTSDGP